MVDPRRGGGGSPAPVAVSWGRIEAWLGEHLPILRLTLRPGIAKKDFARFEKLVGQRLPEDVRESWMIHDGQRPVPYLPDHPDFDVDDADLLRGKGIVFGSELRPLLDDADCLPGGSASREWRSWAEMVAAHERGDPDCPIAELSESCASTPEGAIRRLYACRGWIPLVEAHPTLSLGVDLEPGPRGVVGQIINFGRDGLEKYVLAESWAQFLEAIADELEAGNFSLRDDADERAFGMRRPHPGEFALNLKAWSEAKLAGRPLG